MLHTSGPPGGTANLARDVIEEDDLRDRVNHFRDGLDDIVRRRFNIFKRRPKPWISMSESDMKDDEIYADYDPEVVMGLKRFVNSPVGVIRREAEAILRSQEWQDLNRIERNIRPMLDDLSNRLFRKGIENHNNQQMARGEGKPHMRGGMLPAGPNAPPPPSIPRPRRAQIPQPVNVDANGQALPLNARQAAIRDVITQFALTIDPLWQSIQNMQAVGNGVADTQANRIIIDAYNVAVGERRAAIRQIMQEDQDQEMVGHGMSHMDRGRMWQDMCNRRY